MEFAIDPSQPIHSKRYGKVQRQVFELLNDIEPKGHHLAHRIRIALTALIMLSILSVVLESEPELELTYARIFYAFEAATVALFTVEYFLRVWSIPAGSEHVRSKSHKRLRFSKWHSMRVRIDYITSPLAIIDLVAILPFYLPALIGVDLRIVRVLRLIRLIRVLKLGHYSKSMTLITNVFRKKKHDMAIAFTIIFILLLFASSIMYYIEHDAQPKAFRSIPAAMWWGFATLTTIGYGDIYPVTLLGKAYSVVIGLLGIAVVGLPTSILAAGFIDEMTSKRERTLCERCKTELHHDSHVNLGSEHQLHASERI